LLKLLKFACKNNILIFAYPPHCTHILQGLDVVCFAQLKDQFTKEVHTYEQEGTQKVTNSEFLEVFGRAYTAAMTKNIIQMAFAKLVSIPLTQTWSAHSK
jgi:hypothetical protein